MSDLMREQHAEALMLGLPCPFDCGRASLWSVRLREGSVGG